MQAETKEQCMQLCELAAREENPEKLLAIVQEISRLLEEKERRLATFRQSAGSND